MLTIILQDDIRMLIGLDKCPYCIPVGYLAVSENLNASSDILRDAKEGSCDKRQ